MLTTKTTSKRLPGCSQGRGDAGRRRPTPTGQPPPEPPPPGDAAPRARTAAVQPAPARVVGRFDQPTRDALDGVGLHQIHDNHTPVNALSIQTSLGAPYRGWQAFAVSIASAAPSHLRCRLRGGGAAAAAKSGRDHDAERHRLEPPRTWLAGLLPSVFAVTQQVGQSAQRDGNVRRGAQHRGAGHGDDVSVWGRT